MKDKNFSFLDGIYFSFKNIKKVKELLILVFEI